MHAGWLRAAAAVLVWLAAFPARADFKLLNFRGQLWIIGGRDYPVTRKDIWTSSDGVTWTLVADNLAVLDRELFGAAALNDKLWISAGFKGFSLNDVWASTDGISWNSVSAAAAFPIRNGPQMLSHAGKLWVIGGIGNGALSDVWSSPDGASWTPTNAGRRVPYWSG